MIINRGRRAIWGQRLVLSRSLRWESAAKFGLYQAVVPFRIVDYRFVFSRVNCLVMN
jgi:hypothetical protein